jgi:DNA-binding CsgD family transcriptional regulator
METLSHFDLQALNRAIGEIYDARDYDSFCQTVFHAVQSLVSAELGSFTDLTIKTPRVLKVVEVLKVISGSDAHLETQRKFLPAFAAHANAHPLRPHCLFGNVVKINDFVSRNRFKNMPIYSEYYRHLDIDAQITFAIPLAEDRVTLFTLSRNRIDFTERDRLIMSLFKTHLAIALRNISELASIRLERDMLQRGAEADQQGAVLFQADGVINCISAFAQEKLSDYFNEMPVQGDLLPAKLLEWVQIEQINPLRCFGSGKHTAARKTMTPVPSPLTLTRDDKCLTIKLLHDAVTGDQILFMVETTSSHYITKLQKFNLSQRESEVVLWLARGKTNAEVAIILGISKRTVEKHLEKIFDKLGVDSRAAVADRMRKELM